MGTVLLRADGSHKIGTGHIMRCIALAQGFDNIGVKSIFVIKDYEKEIRDLIRDYGYDVEIVSRDRDFKEDAMLTADLASRYHAKIIITDINNINAEQEPDLYRTYLKALKDKGIFLITIEGLDEDIIAGKTSVPSDRIIIPYYGAEKKRHNFHDNSYLLLGPEYFIFRQDFVAAAAVKKEIKKEASNILVTLGGSDPFNFTIKVAAALTRIDRPDLSIRIIIGASFDGSVRQEMDNIMRSFKGKYEFLFKSDKMAELMLWADIAIISSGLTKYETALTGTPSIVISHDNVHDEIMEEFEKAGSVLLMKCGKNITEEDISHAVEVLLDDPVLREKMSQRGRDMVDGKGVERIISHIPKEMIV